MNQAGGNPPSPDPQGDIEQPPPPLKRTHEAVDNQGGGGEPKKEKKERNWPQFVEATCAILLVGITSFYTYYARQQSIAATEAANAAASAAVTADKTLKEVRQGSTDTHELAVQAKNQADRMKDIATQALAQAQATNRLAEHSRRSADIAARSLEEQRRHWIGYEALNIKSDIVVGKFVESTLVVRNWGGGPAVRVEVEYMMGAYCGKEFPKDPPFIKIEERSYLTLMPGQNMATASVRLPNKVPFTEADIAVFKTGQCALYAYARVHYFDILGVPHWRRFCGYWQPDTPRSFIGCATYNDGDENYKDGKEP